MQFSIKRIDEAILFFLRNYHNCNKMMMRFARGVQQIGKLCVHPYRHPVYLALYAMKHKIRFFPVESHIVFYVVKEEQKTVGIWRFLHEHQSVTDADS